MTTVAPESLGGHRLILSRPPETDDELWHLIKYMWGVKLPRVSVCPEHVSPFEAVAHAYFGREPGFAVWYASRGSGKSLALAVLGLTKGFVDDVDVTILGGSMTQSLNVREHMKKLMAYRNAPVHVVAKDTATLIQLHTGRNIKPLPASQTTVRGPHPPLQLLDEVDEMEEAIYNASLGQAMEQINTHGKVIDEYIVASSTWQNPIGTFTNIIDKARAEGQPVFTWCWRELIKNEANPDGWMSERFIQQKRRTVSAEMWRVEYELNEPSGASRAFDLEAIESYFINYDDPIEQSHDKAGADDEWIWEEYSPTGIYAAGADWAKEVDKTVIVVIRHDCSPRKIVYLRRMNRMKYPIMLKAFDNARKAYGDCNGRHDGTGLGNVVHDFLEHDGSEAGKEIMVGRQRSQLFSSYITDFENGGYRLPRNITEFYKAHRGATTADVFAPHKWDEHTPDDLVAMALAHKVAGRITIAAGQVIPKSTEPSAWEKPFATKPVAGHVFSTGDVVVQEERYDEVGTMWLTGEHWTG